MRCHGTSGFNLQGPGWQGQDPVRFQPCVVTSVTLHTNTPEKRTIQRSNNGLDVAGISGQCYFQKQVDIRSPNMLSRAPFCVCLDHQKVKSSVHAENLRISF